MATSGIFDQPDSIRKLAIEVEGKTFWVSRELLATFSPVFKAMLYGEFDEANKDVIPLPGKKAYQVEELLLCSIPHPRLKEINDWNFQFLLALSDEYQIKEIPIRVEQFLIKKLATYATADTDMLELLSVGSKHRMKQFLPVCVDKCAREFPFDRLKKLFPDLRAEVVASLMIAAFVSPVNSVCRFEYLEKASKKHPAICEGCGIRTRRGHIKCSLCGCEYCGKCVNDENIDAKHCDGDGIEGKDSIQSLLNRM